MSSIRSFFIFLSSILLIIMITSCEKEETLLDREVLFTMPIGKMEDHLFVQQFDGVNTLSKTRIFMKDGFFFISNGESSKVMEFSSFGDLISLYYNSSRNPAPVVLGSERPDNSDITRTAYPYPLSDPGEILKTGGGALLIDDQIIEQRREWDEQTGARLDRIVLKFDKNGKFVSYLGQEGPGGTPFPFIHAFYCNDDDEIIVVTRNPFGWRIYWYTYKGDPLYKIDFTIDLVPMDKDSVTLSIENIIPSIDERVLYLKIDYYTENEARMIKFNKSVMLGYSLDNQKYTLNMELPRNIVKSEQPVIFEEKEHENLYEFAGIARGPSFFLISPYENLTYRLSVVAEDGEVKGRGLIEFSDEDIFFRNYYVNPDGIFSAIVCGEYNAEIVWWRTDRFVEEPKNEYSKFIPNERN